MNYRQQRNQKDRSSKLVTVVTITICLLATFGYLRTRLWVIDLSYELGQLQTQFKDVKKENHKLQVEVTRLRSPSRIENIARTKLGLDLPQRTKTTVIHMNGSTKQNKEELLVGNGHEK